MAEGNNSISTPIADEIRRRLISLVITVITAAIAAYLTIRDNQSYINYRMDSIEAAQKIQAEQLSKIAGQGDVGAGRINELDKNQAIIIEQIKALNKDMERPFPQNPRR